MAACCAKFCRALHLNLSTLFVGALFLLSIYIYIFSRPTHIYVKRDAAQKTIFVRVCWLASPRPRYSARVLMCAKVRVHKNVFAKWCRPRPASGVVHHLSGSQICLARVRLTNVGCDSVFASAGVVYLIMALPSTIFLKRGSRCRVCIPGRAVKQYILANVYIDL